ncbi:MAG: BadF/BadG/BcrA/BcrD ATPase family protein [Dehalococcoidia bacterium]
MFRSAPSPGPIGGSGSPIERLVGLDVGSTTVKAVVIDPASRRVLWSDYQRHETRQAEKVLEFIETITAAFPAAEAALRVFVTGSGGQVLAGLVGAKFVQEVNAVSLAVEQLHPEAGSVVELGGQDAKIIIWQEDEASGVRRKLPSMNDKCAGGTGAVIDKINAKLGLAPDDLRALPYDGVKLHPVAGKCGVFAETDINGLQKQGVPAVELMASLFDAIVQQNLSVLTRGNTLRPTVLLLGGPNAFLPALRDAWRHQVTKLWAERNTPLPPVADPKELIIVPENALYFAALGSALYGAEEGEGGRFAGLDALRAFAKEGRSAMRAESGAAGLVASAEELEAFRAKYALPPFEAPRFEPGEVVEAFLGVDGGSTSTKAVLLDDRGTLIGRSYQLSKGNPIADARDVIGALHQQVESQGATLRVKGAGTTGYAKDILKDTLGADVAIVETVAHTQSALHYYDDVDVIVDVGGQDIKVIALSGRKVKDFRLNTQCSAGNGYFLQSTAQKFGFPVEAYADAAFSAERLPLFSYGCAVFMESDIVNFQQLGWSREEIMAGLAAVLPKNIWLYVVQEPNLAKLGRRFVLQGGTQHNLAAVKSQHDFIKERVPDADVIVHRYTGESGAIGAALEARRLVAGGESAFIGFEALERIEFTSKRDESTRCYFCKNQCLRTFIDTETTEHGARRFIIATCEKGAVEDVGDMRLIKTRIDEVKEANPSFVEMGAKAAFRAPAADRAPEPVPGLAIRTNPIRRRHWQAERSSAGLLRRGLVIGMPRVLNMYSYAPFFSAYFQALGVPAANIVFSDVTTETMWKEGSRRGSIDQCFPSKVALAHVHQLLMNSKKKPNVIFFPALTTLRTDLEYVLDSCACPTVAATPEVVKAAFTKEGDAFALQGSRYFDPVLSFAEPDLLERQLFGFSRTVLQATASENSFAIAEGFRALSRYAATTRQQARETLLTLEREHRVGIVLLARPYHNDPGLNHEIVESLQKCGYPIFTIDSLPTDPDILDRLFGAEVARRDVASPMDIRDVWKNAYSENSSRKLWAAKYVARHPNLVALDLSSFKCGHDAPMYHVVEAIMQATGTPYFTFHDIDENRPAGSIKIRVETIAYFLQRYQEELMRKAGAEERIAEALKAYEERLRLGLAFITLDEEAAEPLAIPASPSARWADLIPLELAMSSTGAGRGCGSSCSSGACSSCH